MSEEKARIPIVGEAVVYHDPRGVQHAALVVAAHGGEHWSYPHSPCVNIVWVSGDESRTDNIGRQIERMSSCCHVKVQGIAHGNYYRFPDEAPVSMPA